MPRLYFPPAPVRRAPHSSTTIPYFSSPGGERLCEQVFGARLLSTCLAGFCRKIQTEEDSHWVELFKGKPGTSWAQPSQPPQKKANNSNNSNSNINNNNNNNNNKNKNKNKKRKLSAVGGSSGSSPLSPREAGLMREAAASKSTACCPTCKRARGFCRQRGKPNHLPALPASRVIGVPATIPAMPAPTAERNLPQPKMQSREEEHRQPQLHQPPLPQHQNGSDTVDTNVPSAVATARASERPAPAAAQSISVSALPKVPKRESTHSTSLLLIDGDRIPENIRALQRLEGSGIGVHASQRNVSSGGGGGGVLAATHASKDLSSASSSTNRAGGNSGAGERLAWQSSSQTSRSCASSTNHDFFNGNDSQDGSRYRDDRDDDSNHRSNRRDSTSNSSNRCSAHDQVCSSPSKSSGNDRGHFGLAVVSDQRPYSSSAPSSSPFISAAAPQLMRGQLMAAASVSSTSPHYYYRVLHRATIRVGFDRTSNECGVLEVGDVFAGVESGMNECGQVGQ